MKASPADKNKKEQEVKTKKAVKPKGPIRLEAIVPVGIIFALIILYFTLFFDFHLRRAMQYGATLANGAEVDIASVRTSFIHASLEISGIEVTDAGNPATNLLQIGKISVSMLWDALLRGKIVIEDASILSVEVNTPRKRPGRVEPRSSFANTDLKDKFAEKFKNQNKGNIFSELADFTGSDNIKKDLANTKLDLKSLKKINELESDLKAKEKNWKSELEELPDQNKIKDIQKRLKTVKVDRFSNAGEVLVSINEITSLKKELQKIRDAVKSSATKVKKDSGGFYTSIKDIDDVIEADIKDVSSKFNIPTVDAKSMALSIFGGEIFGNIQQIQNYIFMARSYMPPPGKEEEKKEELTPLERESGKNYRFGTPKSYPKFLLVKAKVTAPVTGKFSGLSGELRNFSSQPALSGKPAEIELKGSLPQDDISDIRINVTIDHRTKIPREKLILSVGSYPLANKMLVKDKSSNLNLEKANASFLLSAEAGGDRVSILMNNSIKNISLKGEAEDDKIKKILSKTISKVKAIKIDASAQGTWSDLSLKVSSNLAGIISDAMKDMLKDSITGAQKEIRSRIEKETEDARNNLLKSYKNKDGLYSSQFAQKEKQIDDLMKEIEDSLLKVNSQKNGKSNPVEDKLKQEALDRFKKVF